MSEPVEPAAPQSIISSEVQEVPKEGTTMESDEGGDSPVVEDKSKDVKENNDVGDDAETNPTSSEASAAEKEDTPTSEAEEPPKPEEPMNTTPSKPKPFVYDPNKITLKFIFANKDGVSVILECDPSDTVGEVKGALLSMWPDGEIYLCIYAFSKCDIF